MTHKHHPQDPNAIFCPKSSPPFPPFSGNNTILFYTQNTPSPSICSWSMRTVSSAVSIPLLHHSYPFSPGCCHLFLSFFFLFLFIFWLRWVFTAVCRLSLVVVSGGHSSLWCTGFLLWWLLLLRSMGSRRTGFSSCSTWAQ